MASGFQALCRNAGSDAALNRTFSALLIGVAAASGCSAGDSRSGNTDLTEDNVRAIANEFAIEKGMNLLCDRTGEDHLTPFMDELRHSGLPRETREAIAADSVAMMNRIGTEDPEYICTPEMFESAEVRIAEAERRWDEMRGVTE